MHLGVEDTDMSIYMVHKKNPYFKNGAIIKLFEDGFQECVMKQVGHRLQCTGYTGLFKPEPAVKPFCIKMLSRGFDDPKLRQKTLQDTHRDFDFERESALLDA